MASRSHSWFDAEKLLPGEDFVRAGVVRARIDVAPYWWQGELVLTSDRLFFLPDVEHPLISSIAFWLHDLIDTGPAGRNRLHVRTTNEAALFQVLATGPAAVAGHAFAGWLRLIDSHRRMARPSTAFETDAASRRAAG
ncbi:MAG: hypothetical protein HY873_11610 [Chloroflexi bacterium]|nr:hypothetical protein [Chloroflexota bacterium]